MQYLSKRGTKHWFYFFIPWKAKIIQYFLYSNTLFSQFDDCFICFHHFCDYNSGFYCNINQKFFCVSYLFFITHKDVRIVKRDAEVKKKKKTNKKSWIKPCFAETDDAAYCLHWLLCIHSLCEVRLNGNSVVCFNKVYLVSKLF